MAGVAFFKKLHKEAKLPWFMQHKIGTKFRSAKTVRKGLKESMGLLGAVGPRAQEGNDVLVECPRKKGRS